MAMNEATFKPLLLKLVDDPEAFTSQDIELAIKHLATPDGASPTQVGAFLTALKCSGKEKTPDTLSACARVMMDCCLPVQLEDPDDFYVDIVGTGAMDTTPSMCRLPPQSLRQALHGNKASTSSSGSADILRALGCSLPHMTILPKVPFLFLLASHYHPAMAIIAPFRKALPFRTLFNIIGPLINPSRPKGIVVGVAEPSLGPIFTKTLRMLGVRRAIVVCGAENLDEISIAGPTLTWSFFEGTDIQQERIEPSNFGLPTHHLSSVVGSTPGDNAELLLSLLSNEASPSNGADPSAVLDFILLNAAALLRVAGLTTSYKEGVELARESISSGRALVALQSFKSL
ncbi:glycosyl transferase [Cantharellus anzutake]|uniref:glycosyl transferase n=1 Tax=Cantharellus anzutake TaxID=1750568 RepID=UPI0019084758|nr:glycosyl transferase [Cantharellus anzutake]KAF8317760.1 glycosyl transferase [Cantharellus anzutake]